MKRTGIKDKELQKLKDSPFFDDEVIQEIRKDLDTITDEDLLKNKIVIKKATENIVDNIEFSFVQTRLTV
jgi:hypothetical protein